MDQEYVCSITPTEFEIFCKKIVEAYAEERNLQGFHIEHNAKIKVSDGEYQIDIIAKYMELGVEFIVIYECKQYKNKVGRDKVELLYSRLRSIGAHKGVLMSTSGYQSGAIQFAKEHGISLIQVYDSRCITYSYSSCPDADISDDDPFYYGERNMPKYVAVEWTVTNEIDEPDRIYPTKRMMRELIQKQEDLIRKEYGLMK